MSSSMENKVSSTQRGLFAALALAALAIVIYMFCVEPAQKSLAAANTLLQTYEAEQGTVSRDRRNNPKQLERLAALEAELQSLRDAMLTPLLESYAMRAKEILDPIAAESGVTVVDYAQPDLVPRLLPLVQPRPTTQLYARQPVRLTCRGSYAALVSFMLRIEKLLPLVSEQAFSLKAQQDNDVQTATLVLEWPVLGADMTPKPPKGPVKK